MNRLILPGGSDKPTQTDDESEEIQAVSRARRIRQIKRNARLNAIDDYIGFAVVKLSGLGSTLCGVLELLNPDLLLIETEPGTLLGVGVSLLAGRKAVNFVAAVKEALERN